MSDPPLCPKCKLRPQFKMANGRWRGACHECWRDRRRARVPDGAERTNSRGEVELGVGGRWVNKNRHLAKLAGVALEPDMRVRKRGDRLEVAVWQAVVPVARAPRPGPGGGRKRAKRRPSTEITWSDEELADLEWLCEALRAERPDAIRTAVHYARVMGLRI